MKKLFIILFSFFCLTIQATTYYISTTGTDGIGHTGLIADPWKTGSYAVTRVSYGDIIYYNAGTNDEALRINVPLGVSITGAGVTSIINSTYIGAYEGDNGVFSFESASPNAANGNQSISYVKIYGGAGLTGTGAITVNYRNNVEIHHCTIENFLDFGIMFRNTNLGYGYETSVTYGSGNTIHDCIILNCSRISGGGFGNVDIMAENGFSFYNNVITQTARAAGENGFCFKDWFGSGLILYNNVFNRNDEESTSWNFFMEIFFIEGGAEIYSNMFNGSASVDFINILKGTYSFGLKYYDNSHLVTANVVDQYHGNMAIDLEERGHLEYVYVFNNHFKNNPHGIWVDIVGSGSYGTALVNHIYIYNNIFEDIGVTDSRATYPILITGSLDNAISWDVISILNNTIKGAGGDIGDHGIEWHAAGTATNIIIRNNIIKTFYTYSVYVMRNVVGATIDVLNIDNNIFYDCDPNDIDFINITPTNYTHNNNLTSDPLFVSTSDYHLQLGSPAIGAGLYNGYGTTDYDGNAWLNPPSIGAYEYGSGVPPFPKISKSIGGKRLRTVGGNILRN